MANTLPQFQPHFAPQTNDYAAHAQQGPGFGGMPPNAHYPADARPFGLNPFGRGHATAPPPRIALSQFAEAMHPGFQGPPMQQAPMPFHGQAQGWMPQPFAQQPMPQYMQPQPQPQPQHFAPQYLPPVGYPLVANAMQFAHVAQQMGIGIDPRFAAHAPWAQQPATAWQPYRQQQSPYPPQLNPFASFAAPQPSSPYPPHLNPFAPSQTAQPYGGQPASTSPWQRIGARVQGYAQQAMNWRPSMPQFSAPGGRLAQFTANLDGKLGRLDNQIDQATYFGGHDMVSLAAKGLVHAGRGLNVALNGFDSMRNRLAGGLPSGSMPQALSANAPSAWQGFRDRVSQVGSRLNERFGPEPSRRPNRYSDN